MEETSRDDIRRILKTFGIQADEALVAHLARNPGSGPLQIRITLEDRMDYGGETPDPPLFLEIKDEVRRD